jgi:hypothetical protein
MYKFSDFIDSHMIISILSSVGIVIMFLGVFFFTYASIIEQDIVKINVNIIVEDLLDVISPILDTNTKKNIVSSLTYPNMEDADNYVLTNNNNVTSDAVNKLIIITVIMVGLSIVISYYTKNNYLHIIGLNLIILVFIGLTEYVFLHMIVKKFIAADTNYVKALILKKINKKFSIDV